MYIPLERDCSEKTWEGMDGLWWTLSIADEVDRMTPEGGEVGKVLGSEGSCVNQLASASPNHEKTNIETELLRHINIFQTCAVTQGCRSLGCCGTTTPNKEPCRNAYDGNSGNPPNNTPSYNSNVWTFRSWLRCWRFCGWGWCSGQRGRYASYRRNNWTGGLHLGRSGFRGI